MRNLVKLALLITITLSSCNKIKNAPYSPPISPQVQNRLNQQQVEAYADSLDRKMQRMQKQESLTYTLGDYSFYATKYSIHNTPLLLIEHSHHGKQGTTEKRYYLKDRKPVLLVQKEKKPSEELPYVCKRGFYHGNALFLAQIKWANTPEELKNTPFTTDNSLQFFADTDLQKIMDAISQQGEFDLPFEGVIEYPKAKYLVLSRDQVNAYRASILVDKQDEFIRALLINPAEFRGRKLQINWKFNNQGEMVYISGKFR